MIFPGFLSICRKGPLPKRKPTLRTTKTGRYFLPPFFKVYVYEPDNEGEK
jgi:hypothetical protein